MRTAQEIFIDEFSDCEFSKLSDNAKRFIKNAIDQARKEALIEAIKAVAPDVNPLVSRQKIAELVNELKL